MAEAIVDFKKPFDSIHRESLVQTQGMWNSTKDHPSHQELRQQCSSAEWETANQASV